MLSEFLRTILVFLIVISCFLSHAASQTQSDEIQHVYQPLPHKWPLPISPGIQALATHSTDVVLAEVVHTNPRRAIEGARDTVTLKIVEALHGQLKPDQMIEVYYHLIWGDDKNFKLEPAKFTTGQKYFVFLRSALYRDGQKEPVVQYDLTDPWLGVIQEKTLLKPEIAAAVRVAHGDASTLWCTFDGFKARIVAYRHTHKQPSPGLVIYLDVRSTPYSKREYTVDPGSLNITWDVISNTGKSIRPVISASDLESTNFKLATVTPESGGHTRILLSQTQYQPGDPSVMKLTLPTAGEWSLNIEDQKPYLLKVVIRSHGADMNPRAVSDTLRIQIN